MKQRFLCLSFLALVILMVFEGCSKTGPTGATGPQGPAGAAGPQGPKGDTGTANVIYSDWFTPNSYTLSTVFGINYLDYDKAAGAITQAILDSGTVLTFGKLDGYVSSIWPTNQVALLPISLTYVEGSTTYTDTWSSLITLGNLRIQFVDDLNLYTNLSTLHQFRYIVIPGGVHTSSIPKDYQQLCHQYHIPEY